MLHIAFKPFKDREGGYESTPHPTVFCPLLKKSSDDPYLKFLDFSQLLVADTPKKIFLSRNFFLHSLTALL